MLAIRPDITGNLVVIAGEVGAVGLVAILVPLAGEDAFAADALESQAQAADTGEEVDEGEGGRACRVLRTPRNLVLKELHIERGGLVGAILVAAHLALAAPGPEGGLGKAQSCAFPQFLELGPGLLAHVRP